MVQKMLDSPAKPLDAKTRSFFEPRFGHDFSRVRVHADSEAAISARAMNATAYTVGPHIAFDSGKYEPHTRKGQELIAHELTHTLQQSQAAPEIGQPSVGDPSDAGEREASRVASTALDHGPVSIQSQQPLSVQRQANPATNPATPPRRLDLDLAESASPFMAAAVGSVTIDRFETGKAEVSAENQAQLAKTAETILTLLKRYPASTIRVIGHTDAVGQENDNQTLGESRADSVQAALVVLGVPAVGMQTESRGAADLLVKTKKAEGRNRRVEVRFQPSQRFQGAMSGGLSTPPEPTQDSQKPDLSKPDPTRSINFCKTYPDLCPGGPPTAPPEALKDLPSTIPYHLMDVQGLNEPYISHGNKPDDLRATWGRLFLKYRYEWGLSEKRAAQLANSELAGTAGADQSRDYPNSIDQSNNQMKNSYPNSTSVGPFSAPWTKWHF
jgi:outer membrane protein OmpA-like peptidoglycan-associated protein